MRPQDIKSGDVYGRLTVIAPAEKKYDRLAFQCECECGCVTIVSGRSLIIGHTSSCGCYRKERVSAAKKTHGLSNTSEYCAWRQIKNRCYEEKTAGYAQYGGRGIMMCITWLKSFEAFYRDMGPKPSPKHSIDRIDPDGHYTADNCRWATAKEQANNKRNNWVVEYEGVRMTVSELADKVGVPYPALRYRLGAGGLSIEEAVSKPIRQFFEHQGRQVTSTQLAREAGIDPDFLRYRLMNGWTIEEAIHIPKGRRRLRAK